ncbi:MAG: ubiquinone/menaquinone biosynthesis methyltransferase [Elusimicrobia bacterium]|nr:ubiquinone/menaquinone biosynthesis methyltransferase [Elusimicrobiota bacterium]
MPRKTEEVISGFYDGIFHYYDAANRLLTLGLDGGWRLETAKIALQNSPASCLDVCTGTGELAVLLRKFSKAGTEITGADFNESMLSIARTKTAAVRFIRAEAARLPFKDETFDALTVAFAARNLNAGGKALTETFREFNRVLKPGGVFVNLETSQPQNLFVRRLFHLYVRTMTALIKVIWPGNRPAYSFLSRTVQGFYPPEKLSEILLSAGFSKVESIPLTFGAAAIHRAVK